MTMSSQDEVIQPARSGSGIKDAETLGKISAVVCLIGIASMVLIYSYYAGRLSSGLKFRIIFAPFAGCEMIAFITGVFSWNTLCGKIGAIGSMLAFLAFLMSVHH